MHSLHDNRIQLCIAISLVSQLCALDHSQGGEAAIPTPFTPYQTIVIGASAAGPQQVVHISDKTVEILRFHINGAGSGGGASVAVGDFDGDDVPDIVTGAGPGGGPHVNVFSGASGGPLSTFLAFDSTFKGGVFVAAGDVNGDGTFDIIAGAGAGGGPDVKVFDGANGSELQAFPAYPPSFAGGVRVAAGDVNNDGFDDIITGAGPGGSSQVKVFDGTDGSQIRSFFAFNSGFAGGVFVGGGEIDGDAGDDILVGGSDGSGPLVRVFEGQGAGQLFEINPFPGLPNGGARVTAGDIDGDGKSEILASPDDDRNLIRFFDSTGSPFIGFNPDIATQRGGIFMAAGRTAQDDPFLVVGNGPGSPPVATVFEVCRRRTPISPSFPGNPAGISVALSDHTGDAIPDIIIGSGSGVESSVYVYDGVHGGFFGGFPPYDPAFTGGITVAGADFDGDGHSELITGPGSGPAQEVRVFDGNNVEVVRSFFPFGNGFTGGVRVASGDVDGDGIPDIITGAGPAGAAGGGPQVKVFNGLNGNQLHSFFAYGKSFTGGVFVAAGDINGDGSADIITGPGSGMAPTVKVFDGKTGTALESFFAFDPDFTGGVHVAAGDVTGDGVDDIVVSPSVGGPGVFRVFGNGGDDLIAEVPGFSGSGFPIAVADRPTPSAEISEFKLVRGGIPSVRLECPRGLFLHLESGANLRNWVFVDAVPSDGTPVIMEDESAIGNNAWFVRGRAR